MKLCIEWHFNIHQLGKIRCIYGYVGLLASDKIILQTSHNWPDVLLLFMLKYLNMQQQLLRLNGSTAWIKIDLSANQYLYFVALGSYGLVYYDVLGTYTFCKKSRHI